MEAVSVNFKTVMARFGSSKAFFKPHVNKYYYNGIFYVY